MYFIFTQTRTRHLSPVAQLKYVFVGQWNLHASINVLYISSLYLHSDLWQHPCVLDVTMTHIMTELSCQNQGWRGSFFSWFLQSLNWLKPPITWTLPLFCFPPIRAVFTYSYWFTTAKMIWCCNINYSIALCVCQNSKKRERVPEKWRNPEWRLWKAAP